MLDLRPRDVLSEEWWKRKRDALRVAQSLRSTRAQRGAALHPAVSLGRWNANRRPTMVKVSEVRSCKVMVLFYRLTFSDGTLSLLRLLQCQLKVRQDGFGSGEVGVPRIVHGHAQDSPKPSRRGPISSLPPIRHHNDARLTSQLDEHTHTVSVAASKRSHQVPGVRSGTIGKRQRQPVQPRAVLHWRARRSAHSQRILTSYLQLSVCKFSSPQAC